MADLYLQALMQGEILKKSMGGSDSKKEPKNRFEIQTEKEIEAFVATMTFDENDPTSNNFITPEMKRARIKAELKEQAKLSELSGYIGSAFKILSSEGEKYLTPEEFALMNSDFDAGRQALEELDVNSPPADNFQTVLHFSKTTMSSIFKMAVAKFNEPQYADGLSLFILLATLVPESPDYWHRAGILAQKCEKYELATRLYNASTTIDPASIGPWAFSIDCYLKQDKQPDAEAAYAEAMKIYESSQSNEEWGEMLSLFQPIFKKS